MREMSRISNGFIDIASYQSSPHCDDRPEKVAIDMIVIHGISLPPAQFGNDFVEKFFCGELEFSAHPYFETIANLRVSSHLFIKRTGEMIQFVPFHKRAWHAGQSFFQGRENCNDFSIGIELEGTDEISYEKIQYEKLAEAIAVLMKQYPKITLDRIVGHSDIAPGRKTDPGPMFRWDELSAIMVKSSLKEKS
jgi:AmpD protein